MTVELTDRECARLLAILADEQQHAHALRMMTSRAHVGVHGTLADIAEDLANIVDKLRADDARERSAA